MCSRQELRQLLHELLFRLDQVAYLSARTQFNEERNNISNAQQRYGGCNDKNPYANGNQHFENVLRFQRAYIRYFVFALDPYTEFLVPMKSSSLTLFISNILSRDGQTPMTGHTSRTIIEFLQITHSHVVETLMLHYKKDLVKVMNDLNLPYNIDALTKIRHDCFHQNFNDPNSLHSSQVHQIAVDAEAIFFQHNTQTGQYHQPFQLPSTKQEEFLFQIPVQTTSISVLQSGEADQTVNYAPIVHTFPAQTESYIYDLEAAAPLLIITPMTPVNGTQMMIANESQQHSSDSVVEIPLSTIGNVFNEKMTMDMNKTDSINSITGTASNASQLSNHQLCAGCGKPIQDRYLLKALDMLWHEDCLKCGCCDCRLGEVGNTLYTKGNLMLCKRDYLRLFGNTGMCAACNKVIPAFEMVMRARNNVYHLECFACQQCNHRFCVGDRFYLCENKILCEYDYEERLVFASIGNHPMLKRHANTVAQNQPPPPPYTKSNAVNLPNGNGPIGSNGTAASMQQQIMALEQSQSPHQQHQQQQQQHQQQQQQQHMQSAKMQHDDHNNNNNNNHGSANGSSCALTANQFNAPLMKIPHSA